MDYEKIISLVGDMVRTPEKASEISLVVTDLLREVKTVSESMQSDLTTANEKIKALQETNVNLWLRVTGSESTPEQEETVEERVERFWGKFEEEDR